MMDKIVTTAVLFWLVSVVIASAAMLGGEMFEKDNISAAGAGLLIGLFLIALIALLVLWLIGSAMLIQDMWG